MKCVKITRDYVLRITSRRVIHVWILEKVINIRKKFIRDSRANLQLIFYRIENCATWSHNKLLRDLNRLQSSIARCILQSFATMRLSLAISFAIALFFILSTPSTRATDTGKREKHFLPFDNYKAVEGASIINVPIQCPPDKVKVGNRCRSLF